MGSVGLKMPERKKKTSNGKEYWIDVEDELIVAIESDICRDGGCTVAHYGHIFWDKKTGEWKKYEYEHSYDGWYDAQVNYTTHEGVYTLDERAYKRILDAFGIREGILTLNELAKTSPKELNSAAIRASKPGLEDMAENLCIGGIKNG